MKATYLFITAALGVLLLGSSCSTRCESICYRYNACSVSQRGTDIECPLWCSDAEGVAERAQAAGTDCSTQWSEYVTCWEQNSAKVCDATYTECTGKGQAFATCINPYCAGVKAAGGTDQVCNNTTGRTVFTPF